MRCFLALLTLLLLLAGGCSLDIDSDSLVRELREELNVASSCGRCACCARDVLRATLKEIGEREDFAQAA